MQNFLPSYLLIPLNLIDLSKRIKLQNARRRKGRRYWDNHTAYFSTRLDKLS